MFRTFMILISSLVLCSQLTGCAGFIQGTELSPEDEQLRMEMDAIIFNQRMSENFRF